MAKRVPKDEKPFKPVEEALVRAVMQGQPVGGQATPVTTRPANNVEDGDAPSSPRIVEMPRKQSDAQAAALAAATQPRFATSEPSPFRRVEPEVGGFATRNREKRVLLTVSEEHEVERLVSRIAAELRTPVKLSHILRACITMVLHAEGELVDQAKRFPGLTRPGNGNAPELAEFEHKLSQLVAQAFREAPPLR